MYILAYDFSFESAHRLSGLDGDMANIHGHSWTGSLKLKAPGIYSTKTELSVVSRFIFDLERFFDKKLLLNNRDKELSDLCVKNNWDVIVFPENPTGDVIARAVFEHAIQRLGDEIVHSVTVDQTCTCACEFSE